MNVSMMDSYNLAWKLAYSINGLTPDSALSGKPDSVLDTYHVERHTIAQELIGRPALEARSWDEASSAQSELDQKQRLHLPHRETPYVALRTPA